MPPQQLGAAIRRAGYAGCCRKFRVYYDGSTKAALDGASFCGTAAGRLAQQLLATCCTPVTPKGGLFHPKILLFQFSGPQKEPFFRVHIASRNLTMGGMLETGVTLETTGPAGASPSAPAAALADFFRCLQDKEISRQEEACAGLDLAALRRTTLKLCDLSDRVDCTLHFGGLDTIGGTAGDPCLLDAMRRDQQRYSCLRVISMAPDFSLFGPGSAGWAEGKKLEYVSNFRDLYTPCPQKPGCWEQTPDVLQQCASGVYTACVCKPKTAPVCPVNLHAKEYLFSGGNNTPGVIWIGSANCSGAALTGRNVEVMVRYAVDRCPAPAFGNGYLRASPELRFCTAAQLKDPELPPDAADRFLQVRVVGTPCCYSPREKQWRLETELQNDEDAAVRVWLPRGEEKTLAAGSREKYAFSMDRPSRYSQVLLLQKDGEETTYLLPLNLPWDEAAGSREELIRHVPLDPMESVRELVPALKGENTATDEAYERVLKWAVLRPDDSAAVFAQVLEDCEARCRELETRTPGAEQTASACLAALRKGPGSAAGYEEEDLRQVMESAYSTALFLEQILQLQGLLRRLLEETQEKEGDGPCRIGR